MKVLKWLNIILFFIVWVCASGQVPDKPTNYVTDVTDELTDEEEKSINQKLKDFENTTSIQVFVLVTGSTNGEDFTDLTNITAQKWGVGKKGKDNGVLIALFMNDHKLRIEVGYGLEGVLTDAITSNIRTIEMNPLLRKGKVFVAINVGINSIIKASKGEYINTVQDDLDGEDGWASFSDLWILFLIFLGINSIFCIIVIALLLYVYKKMSKTKELNYLKFSIVCGIVALVFYFYIKNAIFGVIEHDNTALGKSITSIFPLVVSIIAIFIAFLKPKEVDYGTTYSSSGYSSGSSSSSDSYSSGSSFSGGGGGSFGGGGSGGSW